MSIKTILVVIDPTKEDQPIISRAIRIARAFDARLELFVAERYPGVDDGKLKCGSIVNGQTEYSEIRKDWLNRHAETGIIYSHRLAPDSRVCSTFVVG